MSRSPDYSLYLVTDDALAGGRSIEWIVAEAVAGGVTCVQLREKHAESRAYYERARALRERLRPLGIPLIINDRLDIALAAGADGVHLGQGDLPCVEARHIAGPNFLIGISVSTTAEAQAAARDGADYLGISPIFDTPTKTDTPPATGIDGLRAIRAAVSLPLVAIGGIKAENAAAVVRAGADGIAVVSAIMAVADPRAAARALADVVARARQQV
ncbi:MAG: thiamine phosphate synthase [Armatimonadetes bacterium]|nr:thiamine phosphate synthase [Armatimonadota bacterium]HOQ27967.1 thiamine phosphate synthase [Armatimonadota bacterium]